jgi:hypothetical protein
MRLHFKLANAALVAAICLAAAGLQAQTTAYIVTTSGFSFRVNGPGVNSSTANPTLNLTAGNTYNFVVNLESGLYSLVILTSSAQGSPEYLGATPQNISSGTIVLTIPATGYPSTLYYEDNVHGFFGTINITAPPPPPPNTIVSVSATTNVVLVSTGTNTTWTLVPEFSSNLVNGAWAAVPVYTNTFANGTNRTVFNRLDAICGPHVYLRIAQFPP